MVKCPKCEFEVANPAKSWQMARRPSKQGDIRRLTIGFYQCPKCNKKFRRVLEKERINLKALIERNKLLEESIMEATRKRTELEEKLRLLVEEKASLLIEIEALKVIPELQAKIDLLESEVALLKQEKKTLEAKIAMPQPSPSEEAAPSASSTEVTAETAAETQTTTSTETSAEALAETPALAEAPTSMPTEVTVEAGAPAEPTTEPTATAQDKSS